MRKTKSTIVFIALLFMLFLPLRSLAQPADWVLAKYEPYTKVYNVQGVSKDLAYRLMRPINFDSSQKYPVIITLHGGTAFRDPPSPRYNIYNLQSFNEQLADDALRAKHPTYVIAPQCKEADMWGKVHITGLKQIIADLPSVDLNRIYVMGQSAGGHGTNNFIKLDPTYFAAAISASADASKIEEVDRASLVNFNLWIVIGENDNDMNRYQGTLAFFNDMKSRNAKMKFTTFFNHGHSTGGLMIGNYGVFSSVATPDLKNGYKTEYAGTNSDPETDTLKWMFSKSKSDNLGIVDYNNALFTIYPNPTNSFVNWTNSLPIDQVVVNDSNGKVLLTVKKPTTNNVDISTLTNGLYFINFYQNDKSVFTKKIIKDK